MKKIKFFILSLSIFTTTTFLAGCVVHPTQQPRWYKDGVSKQQTESVYAQCVYNVGMNKVEAMKEDTLIQSCMKADGFRWGIPPQASAIPASVESEQPAEPVVEKSTKK